jgi:hypothetical protein
MTSKTERKMRLSPWRPARRAAGEISSTKSRRARSVPLARQAAFELRALQRRPYFTNRTDYVFCRPDGGPIDRSAVRIRFIRAQKKAGVRVRRSDGRLGDAELVERCGGKLPVRAAASAQPVTRDRRRRKLQPEEQQGAAGRRLRPHPGRGDRRRRVPLYSCLYPPSSTTSPPSSGVRSIRRDPSEHQRDPGRSGDLPLAPLADQRQVVCLADPVAVDDEGLGAFRAEAEHVDVTAGLQH